mgnify:FL=1|jgi:NADH dehydrogenase
MRVVVVGGGYAGISCLIRLHGRFRECQRILVDPGHLHIKRTRLQEIVRRPLEGLREPFVDLAARFGFRMRHGLVDCRPASLAGYSREGRLPLGKRGLAFDFLVVATGSPDRTPPGRAADVITVADTATPAGGKRLLAAAEKTRRGGPPLAIVGAGATGLQYLFELLETGVPGPGLLLVDRGQRLLSGQPEAIRDYVAGRLASAGVRVLSNTRMTSFRGGGRAGSLRVAGPGGRRAHDVSAVMFCPGSGGRRLRADPYGRVLVGRRTLPNVFSAGDAASWAARGQDGRTAQAAVRKGRHAADNIRREVRGRMMQEFLTPNLGFFLSMGPRDAAGWVASPSRVVTGLPAAGLREAIETRYELMLEGIDTFAAF